MLSWSTTASFLPAAYFSAGPLSGWASVLVALLSLVLATAAYLRSRRADKRSVKVEVRDDIRAISDNLSERKVRDAIQRIAASAPLIRAKAAAFDATWKFPDPRTLPAADIQRETPLGPHAADMGEFMVEYNVILDAVRFAAERSPRPRRFLHSTEVRVWKEGATEIYRRLQRLLADTDEARWECHKSTVLWGPLTYGTRGGIDEQQVVEFLDRLNVVRPEDAPELKLPHEGLAAADPTRA